MFLSGGPGGNGFGDQSFGNFDAFGEFDRGRLETVVVVFTIADIHVQRKIIRRAA